jgi:hypothetical protein
MQQKYADLMTCDQTIAKLEQIASKISAPQG